MPSFGSAAFRHQHCILLQVRSLYIDNFVVFNAPITLLSFAYHISTSFFESLGLQDPLLGSTFVGVINVVATVAGIYLMDRFGRRTLLLWSVGGMFFCTLGILWAMSATYRMKESESEEVSMYNWMAVVFVMAYVSFFEIGLGPIAWLIVAEIFTARLLSSAMGIAILFNWLTNFMVGSW